MTLEFKSKLLCAMAAWAEVNTAAPAAAMPTPNVSSTRALGNAIKKSSRVPIPFNRLFMQN